MLSMILRGFLVFLFTGPTAWAARTLSVQFTVSGTNGFDGVDPASLTLSKGRLSGTVTVIAPQGPYTCSVNAGSTDVRGKLNLKCRIGPDEMVTFAGKLNPVTGAGHGKFSETFFKETGDYTSARATAARPSLQVRGRRSGR